MARSPHALPFGPGDEHSFSFRTLPELSFERLSQPNGETFDKAVQLAVGNVLPTPVERYELGDGAIAVYDSLDGRCFKIQLRPRNADHNAERHLRRLTITDYSF